MSKLKCSKDFPVEMVETLLNKLKRAKSYYEKKERLL